MRPLCTVESVRSREILAMLLGLFSMIVGELAVFSDDPVDQAERKGDEQGYNGRRDPEVHPTQSYRHPDTRRHPHQSGGCETGNPKL